MVEKPMYVTLRLYGNQSEDKLVKRMREEYLGKTFGEVINYVADPNSDDLNESYNSGERDIANRLTAWMNEAGTIPTTKVNVYSETDNGKVGPIRLNDIVSDYNDQIVNVRSEEIEGDVINYKDISLLVKKSEGGGLLL